jgi:PAS domain S-box-containing protein/diguanylate cyclase (GGDEF)-like protein
MGGSEPRRLARSEAEERQDEDTSANVTEIAKGREGYARELLDSARDAGLVVDAAGTIILINTRAAQMLGYQREELQGKPLEQLIPQGLRRSHGAHLSEYFRNPKVRPMGVGISLSALRKDGLEIPIEISLNPFTSGLGTFVLASLRSISPREEWYRSTFEGLAVGVVHSDSEGRLLSVNHRFCELLGYTRAEVLALDIQRLTHPHDIARSVAARAEAITGLLVEYQVDARLIAKSGAPIWTHIITSIVRHDNGGTLHFISLVQDISPQKRAEEQWRESERRFHQVTDNIHEVFWLTDRLKNEMLYVSPGYAEIWGRRVEELYASPQLWVEAIHPEDRQRIIEAVRTKQLAGTYDEEYRIVRPDGTVRWIRDRAFPVRTAGSEVIRFAGVAEDITDRKRTSDELKESERRFRQMLGNVRLLSVMLDTEGTITYCNDYLLQLTGWPREEVLGRSWLRTFVPPESDASFASAFAAVLADRPAALHRESEILTKAGERRLIRWHHMVLRSAAGAVVGSASLGEDVTERTRAEEVHARMAAIVESSEDAIVGKTLDGLITSWNAGAVKLFGYEIEEAIGRPIALILPPERLDEEASILERLRRGERVTHFETERRRKDGSLVEVSLSISPILDSQGRVVGASKIARDITERKRADLKIRHLNRVYAVLSSINGLIVRVRSQDELFREACRIAVEIGSLKLAWLGLIDRSAMLVRIVAWHGMDEEFIRRIPLGLAESGAPGAGLACCAVAEGRAIISNDVSKDDRFLLKAESAERGIRSTVYMPLRVGDEILGLLALYSSEIGFFDEAEMRLLEELAGDIAFAVDHIEKAARADYLAYYDPLTGLANRALFIERLTQSLLAAQAAHEEIVLVLIDVERLGTVNDSMGRQAGDALLNLLAGRIAYAAGNSQSARVAGDVFAIVLQGASDRSDLEHVLSGIWTNVFGGPFRIGGAELSIAAKAGIAAFPADGADAETLLSCAEVALRRAKETGEHYVFHAPEMGKRSAEKRSLETKLRRALEKEEFVLHYQPKLELQTQRIMGAEALLRWQSPDLGLVPPMRFIPLLEETGLILEVGAWVLSRAVADHHTWMQRGIEAPRVAVNVSPVQMHKRDFVETVTAALTGGAVPPGIDLEITESLLMLDVEENIRKLRKLRERGVLIAIDDFGTGYSSLSYLTKLPVQALKIDRSFVLAMSDDPDTMTLVQTIISLAHSLKLKVIAEGVESAEQSKLLRLLRCDEIQGYLFSRPLPFEQMTALLTGHGQASTAAPAEP